MVPYEFDPQKRICIVRPGHSFDLADIEAAIERCARTPDFGPDVHFLSDRRGLSKAPDTAYMHGVIAMARRLEQRFGRRRWALVVNPQNRAMYGVGRMAEAHSTLQDLDMRVFTDFDEAVAWLHESPTADAR